MRPTIVYALASSAEPDRVRYIGQTVLGADYRLRLHLNVARRKASTPVQFWMRKVEAQGHQVLIRVLVENADPDNDERRLIAEYRSMDSGMLNVHDGGSVGTVGYKHDTAERNARSERMRGRLVPEVVKAKISAKLAGRKRDEEAVRKQRETTARNGYHMLGRTHTADAKARNGKKHSKLTDEQITEVVALRRGGLTQLAIAKRFGLCQAVISEILAGKTYAWVQR